ncbi:hypothetical protein KIL84_014939 [Mauremys mutica]|uniref:Uncharacterized protein n=1 Tax=Mauremys mutica TaxID=74926 RepID=A0A9D3XQM9_9SAUR|nr:hypothetical protein KIL84_014939 [Mauremys mutica]
MPNLPDPTFSFGPTLDCPGLSNSSVSRKLLAAEVGPVQQGVNKPFSFVLYKLDPVCSQRLALDSLLHVCVEGQDLPISILQLPRIQYLPPLTSANLQHFYPKSSEKSASRAASQLLITVHCYVRRLPLTVKSKIDYVKSNPQQTSLCYIRSRLCFGRYKNGTLLGTHQTIQIGEFTYIEEVVAFRGFVKKNNNILLYKLIMPNSQHEFNKLYFNKIYCKTYLPLPAFDRNVVDCLPKIMLHTPHTECEIVKADLFDPAEIKDGTSLAKKNRY